MAIRTLVDRDVRSRSFHNLLEEMAQRCSLLSRDRFRTRNGLIAERGLAEGAFADFDLMAGDPEAAHLPASIFYDYQDQLKQDVAAVKTYTDKLIAHRDLKSLPELTWGELDAAIDSLEEHVNNAALALSGRDHVTEPTIQGDWRAVFRQGLFANSD